MLALPLTGSTPELYHGKYVAGMYGSGEQGVWYEPSLSNGTLFQDAAGTTPVTAVEQPVGLMKDKSGRGNHAKQTTSTDRPVFSARYNLLTKTEQFDDVVWSINTKIGTGAVSKTTNYSLAPDGTATACRVVATRSGTDYAILRQLCALRVGTRYTPRVWIKSNTNYPQRIAFGNSVTFFRHATVPTTWTELTGEAVTSEPNGYSYLDVGVGLNSDNAIDVSIWHPSLVPADQAHLPYQRVNTATDYDADPVKFPPYLKFNGTNSWMVTNSIDFTGTDKMTVWAGVRKLSDAAAATVVEHGNSTVGPDWSNSPSYLLFTSSRGPDPVNGYSYSSNMNSGAFNANTANTGIVYYAAPITSVLAIKQDRAKTSAIDEIKFRHNGVDISGVVVGNTNPTGNYGNFPLYIGRRGGNANPLNGNLYSLIIRGAATDDAHLTHAEKYVAYKTGVTL